jgi:hypothetical protein
MIPTPFCSSLAEFRRLDSESDDWDKAAAERRNETASVHMQASTWKNQDVVVLPLAVVEGMQQAMVQRSLTRTWKGNAMKVCSLGLARRGRPVSAAASNPRSRPGQAPHAPNRPTLSQDEYTISSAPHLAFFIDDHQPSSTPVVVLRTQRLICSFRCIYMCVCYYPAGASRCSLFLPPLSTGVARHNHASHHFLGILSLWQCVIIWGLACGEEVVHSCVAKDDLPAAVSRREMLAARHTPTGRFFSLATW